MPFTEGVNLNGAILRRGKAFEINDHRISWMFELSNSTVVVLEIQ